LVRLYNHHLLGPPRMTNRQLAAILFSDIVGYTALMGQDESSTLELVRKSRDIQKPLVEKHQGKWLKEMGDGVMAQFKSALDAVKCGTEIQEAVKNELDAQLRIGIHLGDITIENDEVYGDGVNVASRIESIADPGSVYISEAVYGAIKGQSDIRAQFMGEKQLKNVQGPVRVYKILAKGAPTPPTGKPLKRYAIPAVILVLLLAFGIWQLNKQGVDTSRKTIAVLPLKLLNPDSANQFLIQGITEELIRSLGKVNVLTVINPISTLRFEASLNPVSDARAELSQSDYFLTGSFEENNNLLKLDLRLFDQQEHEVWSKSYSSDISMLPELTGNIAVDIAKFIQIELTPPETARIVDIPPVDPELLKLMLLGKNHLAKFTPGDIAIGLNYLQQAVDKNPASSRAWANLAEGLIMMGHGPVPPPGVWEEARAAAIRAIQLDSLNAEAWTWLGTTKTYYHWDYDGAQYCYTRANSLNSNIPMSHYHYSWHLYLFDSLDKAMKEHKLALELDPLDPFQAARLGELYMLVGDLDSAVMEIERSRRLHKDFMLADRIMGDIYLRKDEYDSATFLFKKIGPFGTIGMADTYLAKGEIKMAMEIIQQLEANPNSILAFLLAYLYAKMGNTDKFFEYANFEPPHAFHPWLRVAVENPKVITDPRFRKLMEKMNLPMPDVGTKD